MIKMIDYLIPFSAPLHPLDKENQTYGCRRDNPSACPKFLDPDLCGFVSDYHICKYPSRKWKNQFAYLEGSSKTHIAKEYRFSPTDPLNSQDTETQTYGCRRRDPDACPQIGCDGICAFSCDDHICRSPSAQWKTKYEKLLEEEGRIQKRIQFEYSDPLNPQDSPTQTYGCRKKRPDICAENGSPGICAFVCKDNICRAPSRKWRSMYEKLKKAQ